jgi:hypothetical protein
MLFKAEVEMLTERKNYTLYLYLLFLAVWAKYHILFPIFFLKKGKFTVIMICFYISVKER